MKAFRASSENDQVRMSKEQKTRDTKLVQYILSAWGIELFGIADLEGIDTPRDVGGGGFPRAVSFAVPMNPDIMGGIRTGPNQRYADEYNRVNIVIDEIAAALEEGIVKTGFRARMISASDRNDHAGVKGDFPHKTAATRAGLGWVGRNCQLISKRHGPWLRLGTVLTDLPMPCDTPVTKSFCGTCRTCVDACPAGALVGNEWYPGISRKDLLDVPGCDMWKKEQYRHYNEGHNCGICAAVCPFGK